MNKYYVQQAARTLTPALFYSGIHQITKPFYSGIGQILMFHRVLPKSNKLRIHNHESLEITPESLEGTIDFFRKRGYDFISFDDLPQYQKPTKRKFVIFTFDDGYVDNFETAYPIFKKHRIPFTIYITTGLPDGHAFPWWYWLEDLIVKHESLELNINGKPTHFTTYTLKAKEITFNQVRSILAVANKNELEIYKKAMFGNYVDENAQLTKSISMSWSQIEELSKDPLVTIGSHTVNHYPLKSLTAEESKFELSEAKKIIESKIKKEVKHFCYPIGSYSPREIILANECGYQTATTVNMSNFSPEHFAHPFALPRIMVNALTTEKLLTLQVNGLLPFLRNKGRRVVI